MDWKTEGEKWGKNVASSGYDKREIAEGWRTNDFKSAYSKHVKKCEENNETPDDKERQRKRSFQVGQKELMRAIVT